MSDFKATVIINHPQGEKTYTLESSTMKGLKNEISKLAFEDFAGENFQNYNQWRADNYLKPVKLTTKK